MTRFRVGDLVRAPYLFDRGEIIRYAHHEVFVKDWGTFLDSDLELVEPEEDADNAVAYYVFPGGVEVRQISGHLTGFGSQALQYIARSTRLDGNNKGDPIRDLEKAKDFIEWEIERLRDQNNAG